MAAQGAGVTPQAPPQPPVRRGRCAHAHTHTHLWDAGGDPALEKPHSRGETRPCHLHRGRPGLEALFPPHQSYHKPTAKGMTCRGPAALSGPLNALKEKNYLHILGEVDAGDREQRQALLEVSIVLFQKEFLFCF